MWVAIYFDGTYKSEETANWHELDFPLISNVMLIPKTTSDSKIVLNLVRHPDYLIVKERWQTATLTGTSKGTDYALGLVLDDGSPELQEVQQGWRGPEYSWIFPGFKFMLKSDNTFAQSGRFSKTYSDLSNGFKLITLKIED